MSDANSVTEDLSIGDDTLAAGFEKLGVNLGGDDQPVQAAQPQAALLAAIGVPVMPEPHPAGSGAAGDVPSGKRSKRGKKSRHDETGPTPLTDEVRHAEKRSKKEAKKGANPDGDAQ